MDPTVSVEVGVLAEDGSQVVTLKRGPHKVMVTIKKGGDLATAIEMGVRVLPALPTLALPPLPGGPAIAGKKRYHTVDCSPDDTPDGIEEDEEEPESPDPDATDDEGEDIETTDNEEDSEDSEHPSDKEFIADSQTAEEEILPKDLDDFLADVEKKDADSSSSDDESYKPPPPRELHERFAKANAAPKISFGARLLTVKTGRKATKKARVVESPDGSDSSSEEEPPTTTDVLNALTTATTEKHDLVAEPAREHSPAPATDSAKQECEAA